MLSIGKDERNYKTQESWLVVCVNIFHLIAFYLQMLVYKNFQCCSACKRPYIASPVLKPQL